MRDEKNDEEEDRRGKPTNQCIYASCFEVTVYRRLSPRSPSLNSSNFIANAADPT